MKNPKRHLDKSKRKILLIAFLAVFTITGFTAYWFVHSNRQTCEITKEMRTNGPYKVPCDVYFTTSQALSHEQLKKILEHLNAELTEPPDADGGFGIYDLRVPPGTEEQAITYLESQPNIDTVAQNSCCAVAN